MLDPAIPAAAGRGHPVVVGVVGAAVQVAGGAAVVVAEEEGLGGLGGLGWGAGRSTRTRTLTVTRTRILKKQK